MSHPDRGIGRIDVLPAGARSAVNIHPNIRRVEVDINVVIHFRRDKHCRKRRVPSVTRVKRGLTNQAMNAGFRAAPAISVITGDMNCGALNSRDIAGGDLDEVIFPAAAFSPTQVHTQQHLSPILGFGTARTRLDIDKTGAGVHFSSKHSLEFQAFDIFLHLNQIATDRLDDFLVLLFYGKLEHLLSVRKAAAQRVQGSNDGFQPGSLTAQFLGFVRLVPNFRIFQFPAYFLEPVAFLCVVKGTP